MRLVVAGLAFTLASSVPSLARLEAGWFGGTGLICGVGVNVFVAPSIPLAAEWRRYPEVGKLEETGHEDDIDAITVGVLYHFGKR